jgi:hypothetical protein
MGRFFLPLKRRELIKMAEIKILINWDERKVYSEEELIEQIEREIKHAIETEVELDEWLDYNYSVTELFHMDEEERTKVLSLYEDYIREKIKNEYAFYYDTYSFKVN